MTRRVVFNDGELDTGNIAPGAFSAAMGFVAPSPYHCSIHPPMVGAIVAGQRDSVVHDWEFATDTQRH